MKKNHILGIDIGFSSIKAVKFIRAAAGFFLISADLKEIPFTENEAFPEADVISAVRALAQKADAGKCDVIVNINSSCTAIKRVIVPFMPKEELFDGVQLEAQHYFPFPVDDALLDFEIRGEVTEKGIKKYELIVATIPRGTAEKYAAILKQAGIRPLSLVISAYALQKAGGYALPDEDKATCLIDIGELYTELIIYKGRCPVFSRKIPCAGGDFTKAMTGVLVSERGKSQLSRLEAEEIKRDIGLPSDGDPRIINDKISTGQILSLMRMPLEQLAGEIERCLEHYAQESAAGGSRIDSVVLFGGGALLGGLAKYLAERLGVEVGIGDPFEGLQVDKNMAAARAPGSHRFALAAGAALSDGKGINLLPAEMKDRGRGAIKRGIRTAVIPALILSALMLYTGMRLKVADFNTRISAAQEKLGSLREPLRKAEGRALISAIMADEPYWEDMFMELSNRVSDRLFLEHIEMKNNTLTMMGVVDSARGEQILSDFMLALGKGMFDNVMLVSSRALDEKGSVEFELKCRIAYENNGS